MSIDLLLAERAIARALTRIARAMDARDWDGLAAELTDDATAELGTGPLNDPDAIIALIRSYLDACGPTQHLLGNLLVDVEGDTASSRCYVSDLHLGPSGKQDVTFATLGDYHDQWRCIDGRWKLAHRTKLNRAHIGSFAVFGE